MNVRMMQTFRSMKSSEHMTSLKLFYISLLNKILSSNLMNIKNFCQEVLNPLVDRPNSSKINDGALEY